MDAEALPPTPRTTTTSITAEQVGPRHLLAAWTVFAMGCVSSMAMVPGEETIPYHLGWASFALAFGLGTWGRRHLVIALTWYTLATGVVLVRSALLGHIGWEETTEIPLMFLLALLMVWNVLRRQIALTEVSRLAERDLQAAQDRERLTQLTSHELRTPLTIARGYVELMQIRAVGSEDMQDLSVVADELDRLSRVSDRLIRMIGLQDDTTSEIVDIDGILAQALERWRVVTDRRWVLEADAGNALGSPERLRTCIDTLVENAIRYTSVGDTIRLVGSRRSQHILVGVLDSGVGLSEQQIIDINGCEQAPRPSTGGGTKAAAGGNVAFYTKGAGTNKASGNKTSGTRTAATKTAGTNQACGTKTAAGAHSGAAAETKADADTAMVDLLAGTGLGLSIVRQIARARGGALYALHAPEGGAALTIAFPLHYGPQTT